MTEYPTIFAAIAATLAEIDRPILSMGARSLSGRALLAEVERWAAGLASLGIRPGDRVVVQADKSIELVSLYLAVLRVGAVHVPLNDGYRSGEIAYFLGDSGAALFVCGPEAKAEYLPVATQLDIRVETLGADGSGSLADIVAAATVPAPPHGLTANDLAVIVYTSGTTGRPKGAMISHANLIANARALIAVWGVTPSDCLLHALPLFHIHGLFISLNTLLLAGGRIQMLPAFDAQAVIARLAEATLFMGVPTYYTRLLASPAFDRECTATIRLFVCGSAPLTPTTFAEFEERTGQRILERYGMSECGIICSNPLNGPRIAGAVGNALPGVTVRIGGGAQVGVLEVQGPSVFSGYWRQPEKTRAEFTVDGYFITGDVATIDADGVVRIVGRAKDMIITGGLNVYPKEIEELIDALPAVAESAVVGVPHPDFGEAVVAAILPLAGETVSAGAVIDALKPLIAGFKVPKAVFVIDEMPRNTMGKVQKVELRARYQETFA